MDKLTSGVRGPSSSDDAPSLLVVGESGVFSCVLPAHGEVTVGRAPDCDVVVDDPSMSRRHLTVRTERDGSILITDLGGPNGTSLGERRLPPRVPTLVPVGAALTAASTVIVLRTRAQASRAYGLVSHAELRAQLIAECNRGGATLKMGVAFALVKVQAVSLRDARAIEEALGGALRKRDVLAAVAPGSYVALLSETTAARADAVASRVSTLLTARGVEAKVQIVVFPRDGDTPELLAESEGTAPSPRATIADAEEARASLVTSAASALDARISALASSTANVLVFGEQGVGKEVVARAIHARSPRASGPFLHLDCSAPAEPAEAGVFAAARGGSVFLDGLERLHPTLEAHLAAALEPTAEALDVRFFSSTRLDPERERIGATLRPGLLRALDGARLGVPPLRARVDEIEPLARAFVRAACAQIGRRREEIRIAAPALALLKHHSWPRNVRELKDVIDRAVLLAGDVITLEHLPCETLAPVVAVRRVHSS